MSKGTNFKLLIILLVMILIFVIPSIVSSQKWIHNLFSRDTKLIVFDFANADGIVIKKGTEAVTLVKDKDTWQVNDKPASVDSVKKFLDSLSGMREEGLASTNTTFHKDFSVDEENGYTVVVKKGKNELGFIVGSPATKLDSFYLRKVNDNNVYVFTGTVLDNVSSLESSWVQK